jgi:hypothetical protein
LPHPRERIEEMGNIDRITLISEQRLRILLIKERDLAELEAENARLRKIAEAARQAVTAYRRMRDTSGGLHRLGLALAENEVGPGQLTTQDGT